MCTSVNEVVCHGIPDLRELQASYREISGDIGSYGEIKGDIGR